MNLAKNDELLIFCIDFINSSKIIYIFKQNSGLDDWRWKKTRWVIRMPDHVHTYYFWLCYEHNVTSCCQATSCIIIVVKMKGISKKIIVLLHYVLASLLWLLAIRQNIQIEDAFPSLKKNKKTYRYTGINDTMWTSTLLLHSCKFYVMHCGMCFQIPWSFSPPMYRPGMDFIAVWWTLTMPWCSTFACKKKSPLSIINHSSHHKQVPERNFFAWTRSIPQHWVPVC